MYLNKNLKTQISEDINALLVWNNLARTAKTEKHRKTCLKNYSLAVDRLASLGIDSVIDLPPCLAIKVDNG